MKTQTKIKLLVMSKAEKERDLMRLTRNSESLIPTSLRNMAKKKWKNGTG